MVGQSALNRSIGVRIPGGQLTLSVQRRDMRQPELPRQWPAAPCTGGRNALWLENRGTTSAVLQLLYRLPRKLGFRFGRTGFRVSPEFVGLYPSCGLNGNPVCRFAIVAICQPEIPRF